MVHGRCARLLRPLLEPLVRLIWRPRVVGAVHVPAEGGALLVANHVSYVDPFLVQLACERPVRFLMHRGHWERPGMGHFARLFGARPIDAQAGPRELLTVLAEAAEFARAGEVVCIFGEGRVSRTGALAPFARGLERIARRAGVPIVPIALTGVWGTRFSWAGGRLGAPDARRQRLGMPREPIQVRIGAPLPSDTPAWAVRSAVQSLAAESARASAAARRGGLGGAYLAAARRAGSRPALFDAAGVRSHRRLLVSVLALRRALGRRLDDTQRVAVVLPASEPGVLVNVALAVLGRVSVNLNVSLGEAAARDLARRSGATRVVTSRRYLEALGQSSPLAALGEDATVYVEDLVADLGRLDKLRAAGLALLPAWLLRRVAARAVHWGDPATVLYSSGSTSEPKGVVLSHGNVLSNLAAVAEHFEFTPEDRLLAVLPHFHSFGYTVTLWAPLLGGASSITHPNPLEAKKIGRLAREHGATIALATPAFYQAWLRRADPADFASLRAAVVGAQRLPRALAEAWESATGVALCEGYGCTELAPVVAACVPPRTVAGSASSGGRLGSVGHPLPGVALEVRDLETGAPCPPGAEGLLFVRGPNVMLGYLDDPERTAEVLRDGWYATGDVARIEADGCLVITDRLSRFSKVGGEMVPHGAVEDALADALGRLVGAAGAEIEFAVTAVEDSARGERLVVVHTPLPVARDALAAALAESDLPRLFLPRPSDWVEVEALPRLASGKLDLRALRAAAERGLGAGV